MSSQDSVRWVAKEIGLFEKILCCPFVIACIIFNYAEEDPEEEPIIYMSKKYYLSLCGRS
jgi:hypothetical protein